MAIIYSYPLVTSIQPSDLLILSVDSSELPTRQVTVGDLLASGAVDVNLNFTADTGTGSVNLSTQSLEVRQGVYITTTATNQELIINHKSTVRQDTNIGDTSPGYGGSFTVIDSVVTDATGSGHVTGVNLKTVTLPAADDTNTTYDLLGYNTGIELVGSDGTRDQIQIIGGGGTTVSQANNIITVSSTSGVSGSGTTNTLTKWTGPTTLGDSIVSESGTTLTIAGDLTLERDQSDTTLTLVSDTSNIGEQNNPSIKFIQDGGSQNAAVGFNIIDDTAGGTLPGTGNRFWIVNSMASTPVGDGGITFGTAQVDGWENAIGRFIIRGDGKGLFGHPDSLYSKTLGSQFEIYDNRDENTTTDPSFSVYSVVDTAAPSGNEGAGGIKQILDIYDNGVFQQQEAIMLIPGTNSSDLATSTPLAFYTNSDMDTASPSGFAGIIFNSGNWLLDGSGTFTTTDPGYQLKVAGTGLFTGQVTIPETPVAGTDAASKAYVDLQSTGQVSGTGTTNTLPVWSDGPNSILNNSTISQVLDAGNNVKQIDIVTTSGQSAKYSFNGAATKFSMYTTVGNDWFLLTGDNTGFYQNNFNVRGTLAVGRSSQAFGATLDVGTSTDTIPAAWFRNGVVISNNPSGVQVDNTSMVIGAGNNDNVSGSDHCLIVGSNNQITSNSDQSVAFGQGNAITGSIDAFAVGNSNTLTSSLRTQAIGFNNTIAASSSFVAGGGNSITASSNIFALGDGHTVTTTGSTQDAYLLGTANTITGGTGSFAIGSNLDGDTGNHMVLGYRNNKTSYPVTDYSLGLGNTKFALAVGSTTTTNSNALLITEGGVNRGGGVAQVPRIVLPTISGFSATDDTAAGAIGIPLGGLYQSNGNLRINTGSIVINEGSWTPTIGAIGASNFSFTPIAGGANVGYYIIQGNIMTAWFTIPGTATWTGTSGFPLISGLPYAFDNTLSSAAVLSADISKTQGLSAQATGVSFGPSNTSLGINVLVSNNSTNMGLNGTGIVNGVFFSLTGCIRYKLL